MPLLDFETLSGHVLRWDLLGLPGPVEEKLARQAYRLASKEAHPDRGGDHEDQVALNEAWEDICEFMAWPK